MMCGMKPPWNVIAALFLAGAVIFAVMVFVSYYPGG